MPPSQLKRLKASLREQGLVGPQQSKKQKKQTSQNGSQTERRIHKTAALAEIREQFQPFEVKGPARAPKFEVTTNKSMSGRVSKATRIRPGVSKGLGEENRRNTLLKEMQRRNKIGGILDRRFGEDDPTMAPEDKMLERFAQEKQRRHKTSTFDLEDDNEDFSLTHMGQSLSLDGPAIIDDFDENFSDDDQISDEEAKTVRKRRRELMEAGNDAEPEAAENAPDRKKSKQEVMQEVMAKSKLHKYERQAAKDEDEDLREELDKEMSNIHALLTIAKKPPMVPAIDTTGMDAERAARLQSTDKAKLEKEYDVQLKRLAQDARSKPTEKSKTEEERAAQQSQKLQALEQARLLRMQGNVDDRDEEERDDDSLQEGTVSEDDFGLGSGIKAIERKNHSIFEDEDEFLIDDDLIASDISSESEASAEQLDSEDEDEEDFTAGLLTVEEAEMPEFSTDMMNAAQERDLANASTKAGLAYTFPCPQNHQEILDLVEQLAITDLPVVVQRIRALYHPKLGSENKIKLANFAASLVDHTAYLADKIEPEHASAYENVIRHVHSLAKMFPVEVAQAFRRHLSTIHESRPLALTAGDLMILTCIGTIFPTSDHFHQVVTPAMLTMARYLGQKIPQTYFDHAIGVYLSTLCLAYQDLSKRYIPEVMNFLENTISVLAPVPVVTSIKNFPRHLPKKDLRIQHPAQSLGNLSFQKLWIEGRVTSDKDDNMKTSLLETSIRLLEVAADTWVGKSAFLEVFEPAALIIEHLFQSACRKKLSPSTVDLARRVHKKLQQSLSLARLDRRALELHHHRPLAIKTAIPRFEESFDPDKHYDPNRERAEAAKLRAEHKKEKKGAMRELRKDANFIARESLKEKKERDRKHDEKMRKLVAEIQGEEGMESNKYEREKQWRKKSKGR